MKAGVIREYGEGAVLVEHDEPLRLWAALRGAAGVDDVVPAVCTVLVIGPGAEAAVRAALAGPLPSYSPSRDVIEVPVSYDGADLHDIAGLSADEVVVMHAAPVYTVAFVGFAPGFGYLSGLDARLRVERLATPRTSVPAGSVAIAGEWCAIYPTASPGGWKLLGHTDMRLFDPAAEDPALLHPGDRVRFVPAG